LSPRPARADLVLGPAVPVPGLAPNPNPGDEDFSWASADGRFVYVGLGHYTNRIIASRSWDEQAATWTPPVGIGIGPDSNAAYPSPDGNTIYYNGSGGINRSHWDGTSWSPGELVPNVNGGQYGNIDPVFNG